MAPPCVPLDCLLRGFETVNIAIIGAGISGNLAARLLATRHRVTLYEAGDFAGGHTNTVDVATSVGTVPVDTGFMVFNQRTYPNFCRMLELLGTRSQSSDMSFSVRDDPSGIEYCGSSLNTLFAQRSNLLRPRFFRLVRDILRFNRAGEAFAAAPDTDENLTLGEFLAKLRLGKEVCQLYLVPMLAAIWSASPSSVESLPARFIIGFMHNHGLMQIRNRPQWRTIVGGAREYVNQLLAPIIDCVQLRTPITHITRRADSVSIQPMHDRAREFDAVVLATHADRSLAMLTDATQAERDILGAFPYQPNMAILHSDPSSMPSRQRAWASWNYRIPLVGGEAASVTYDLNRLQNLPTDKRVFLTLNPTEPLNPASVHRTFNYRHPSFSVRSARAQRRWHEINGQQRTWFCGAYWGYGFHEDGVQSALRVAQAFGLSLEDLAKPAHSSNAQPAAKCRTHSIAQP